MSEQRGLLYCELGAERYALWSADVRHVERAEHLRPDDPGDGRAGVLKLGEYIVPVFSLARVLGRAVDRSARAEDHIAVTGDRGHLIGWLVDRVIRADASSPVDIAPIPALVGTPATAWFDGIVRIDEQTAAPLLAPQRLNPFAPTPAPRSEIAAGEPASMSQPGTPVAVVFSTKALPPAAGRYALSGRQIASIMQPVAVMPLPGCADHVAGIIRWRRAVVPVIDFRAPEERSGHSDGRRLIAQCGARHGGALVAFSIDADVMLCRADAAHRQLRDVPCPSFASGIFDVNGEPVALLDLDALLDPLRLRNGDPVLPDLLIEGAARDTQAVSGPLDAPAFGV